MDIDKRVLAAAAALAMTAGLANAQDLITWKQGTVLPKGDAGFIYMAAEKDFDKKYGLDIEMVPMKGDSLLTKALLAGELDAYEGNPGGPMIAASKGADIKVIGCHWPGLTYAIYTKPEIEKVEDLKGKAIGVSAPGSLPDLFARAVVRAGGLNPEEDVSFVMAGGDADRVKALVSDVVAAAPSSSEFAAAAPEMGLKMLVHARDIVPDYMRLCMISTGDVIKNKRDAVVRFLAAEMDAHEYALENREETIALSHEITGKSADDPNAAQIYDEVKEYGATDPSFSIEPDKLIYLRDLLSEGDHLDPGFDPTTMIDDSLLSEAQELRKQNQKQ
jgi:NitT/TauT family transport system substrate-binding protein